MGCGSNSQSPPTASAGDRADNPPRPHPDRRRLRVVREGVKALLEREADLQVTAYASDGMDAVNKAITADVDLAILDIAMPKLTGLQAAREIARHQPDLPILLLSMHAGEQYFFEAVAAGAAGYVLKQAVGYVLKQQVDRDLTEACRAALRGEPFIYPSALSMHAATWGRSRVANNLGAAR